MPIIRTIVSMKLDDDFFGSLIVGFAALNDWNSYCDVTTGKVGYSPSSSIYMRIQEVAELDKKCLIT